MDYNLELYTEINPPSFKLLCVGVLSHSNRNDTRAKELDGLPRHDGQWSRVV